MRLLAIIAMEANSADNNMWGMNYIKSKILYGRKIQIKNATKNPIFLFIFSPFNIKFESNPIPKGSNPNSARITLVTIKKNNSL